MSKLCFLVNNHENEIKLYVLLQLHNPYTWSGFFQQNVTLYDMPQPNKHSAILHDSLNISDFVEKCH